MASPWKTNIVRNFALSLWGLITLVLIFTVLLLLNEMLRSGQDPLDSLRAQPEATARPQTARPATTVGEREVQLFYADDTGSHLAPQPRTLEFTDSTVENCRRVLEALLLGPTGGGSAVISPSVRVRALYLMDNGELVIDFSREFLSEQTRLKSASLESLMVQGVVNTLTQGPLQTKGEPAIRRVRFLVEGSAPPESFPAHIDLAEPVEPDSLWLAPAPAGGAANE
ncbi:MAG: hypothetical protein RLZZ303_970 [Candidatus Hydrogenedentota bacterium]|jgi:spore germination protein GerM